MFDNYVYNLLIQLVEEHKSIWRIENYYIKDCGDRTEDVEFWEKMAADKEAHIKVIEEKVKEYLTKEV